MLIKEVSKVVADNRSRALTEGALFAAITVVLGLLGLYFPFFFFISIIVMPLPLAVLVRRHDLRLATMALLVASVLLFILAGRPLSVFLLVLQTGPMGLLLGLLFKNGVPSGVSVVAATIMAAGLTVLSFLTAFFVTGVNPFVMGNEMFRTMDETIKWYQSMGWVDNVSAEELKAAMEQSARLVVMLLPANLMIWSGISAYLTYLSGVLVFKRLGYSVKPIPPFSRWRFPWHLVWGIIAGLSLMLLGDERGLASVSDVGKNILYIIVFIYFIQGLSVLTFFLKNWKIAKFLKFTIVVIFFLYWPFALSVLFTMGLMEPFLNVRRLPAVE